MPSMAPPFLSLLFLLPLLLILLHSPWATSQASPPISLPGCRNKCGNITVPYPFGFEPNCFREGFRLVCNESYNPPRLFIEYYGYEITDISPSGELHISITAQRACYNSSGDYISGTSDTAFINLDTTPYLLSIGNSFFAVGCPTQGYFTDGPGIYVTGCISACLPLQYSKWVNESCTGVGCCRSSIPSGLNFYEAAMEKFDSSRRGTQGMIVFDNPTNCSYVFIADSNWFRFDNSYLSRTQDFKVQVAIDWAVRDVQNCSHARRHLASFACRSINHDCYDSDNGIGYLCSCSKGYQGNPYISGGCQDINECLSPIPVCNGTCRNTIGGFECIGIRGGQTHLILGIVIGISSGIVALLFVMFTQLLIRRLKREKQKKIRKKNFNKNQGMLLQQLIPSGEVIAKMRKIFSLEELEIATNNFDRDRILGQGGHGTIYKGILLDQGIIAIKKAKLVKQTEIHQFINEVAILSQIIHRNVVKLFGCCLETEVPLLVYEFISNGTLYDKLHKCLGNLCSLTWRDRLRIAIETAGALSYLHSAASISIFHRDVKSSNILLDDNYTVKVSDFGASRSMPIDQKEVFTAVQGTFGYLDPQYHHTGQLTEKSDVYSFGVIIVELLTRKQPIFTNDLGESTYLSNYFRQALRDGSYIELIDVDIRDEFTEHEMSGMIDLVEMCLKLRGEERPTMKEVEMKLQFMHSNREKQEQPSQTMEEVPLLTELVSTPNHMVSRVSLNFANNSSIERQIIESMSLPR